MVLTIEILTDLSGPFSLTILLSCLRRCPWGRLLLLLVLSVLFDRVELVCQSGYVNLFAPC